MDAVGKPHVAAQPAQALHIGQGADALPGQHVVLLVPGLAQVGVEPDAVLPGQDGALAQQLRRHGEGGAGGQGQAVHGAEGGVVIPLDAADAVGHDLVHRLHHAVRRQAPVLHGQIHTAPAGVHADAQLVRRGKLGPQQIAGALGEHVVVVEAGGAAVLHQLPHAGEGGQAHHVGVQILPNLVEGLQPVEQLHVLHLGQVPGEHLVEVVVGVDKAGIAQHVRAVQHRVGLPVKVGGDGPDDAVFGVQIHVFQQGIVVVTGDEGGDIANQ